MVKVSKYVTDSSIFLDTQEICFYFHKKHQSKVLFSITGTRTVGVISKIDQAASDQKVLAAVQALILNQGPSSTCDIPWIALIGQSVSIASAQSGNVGFDDSLETAWRAETESLKSILTGAPQSKLGRLALVETLAYQIRSRMKIRLPNLLSGYIFSFFSLINHILNIIILQFLFLFKVIMYSLLLFVLLPSHNEIPF